MKTSTKRQKLNSWPLPLQMQLGLAYFAFLLIGANDGALGLLIPSLRLHYGIDAATLSWFFLLQNIGYLLAAFTIGLLIRQWGNRLVLLVGTVMFLLGVGALSLRLPFVVVLVMLIPFGFGIAIIDAGFNALVAAWPQNAAKLNALHALYGTGALLGSIVTSAFLAVNWGWSSVYFVWAGLSFVLLIGVGFVFKRQRNATLQEASVAKGNVLLLVLRIPAVWVAALFLLFYVGIEISLGSWGYSFLLEARHGSSLLMGWAVSGYWAGLTVGRFVSAGSVQRVAERRLISICLLGVGMGVLLIWLVPLTLVAAGGFCLTGFCLGPIYPTTIALMSKRVSADLLSSAVGFLSLGGGFAAVFPWLAGRLIEGVGLWSLMPYVLILTGAMMCFWLLLQVRPVDPFRPCL